MDISTASSSIFTEKFEEIPEKLIHKSCYMNVKKKEVTLSLESKALQIQFLESLPRERNPDPPVILFLHDEISTSQTWDDIGTLTLLSAIGWRVVALDLPEYGNSRGGGLIKKEDLITAFMDAADIYKPVLVSPGISGIYSVPYLLANCRTISDKLTAFIAIGPHESERFLCERQTNYVNIPIISLYGSNDETNAGSAYRNMLGLRHHKKYLINGAGQRCYVNETDEFHFLLYNIIKPFSSVPPKEYIPVRSRTAYCLI